MIKSASEQLLDDLLGETLELTKHASDLTPETSMDPVSEEDLLHLLKTASEESPNLDKAKTEDIPEIVEGEVQSKEAGIKRVAINGLVGAGLAGAGYVGGRAHERSKDENEDKAIFGYGQRVGAQRIIDYLKNRVETTGNRIVPPVVRKGGMENE